MYVEAAPAVCSIDRFAHATIARTSGSAEGSEENHWKQSVYLCTLQLQYFEAK